MRFEQLNPVLYLEDYEEISDDILRWKDDAELQPGAGWLRRAEQFQIVEQSQKKE